MTSRPTVLASAVLALALLGDSLLYAVLPLHASTFGVSLTWVGVLLSANRIVRVFAYPMLARLAATGIRDFTITAAAAGALSTLAFATGSGAWMLLAVRLAWGVAFGCLSLSTLAYATASQVDAGTRVGLSLSVRELGPLLSLTAGTAAVAAFGVRPALAALGTLSLTAIGLAAALPDLAAPPRATRAPTIRLLRRGDWLSFCAGFALDGVFPATIGLLLAQSKGLENALLGTGLLLAFKRIAVLLLAPAGGRASDRFGADVVTTAGFAIAAAGAVSIASGGVIAGAILISCGAAITTASIPLVVATRHSDDRLAALARAGMARDAGAAAGPLAGLALFGAGPVVVYAALAVVFAGVAGRAGGVRRAGASG